MPNAAQPSAPRETTRTPLHRRGSTVALQVLAVSAAIALARFLAPVLVPTLLAVLLFYALDPFVGRLARFRIPRALCAVAVMSALVCGVAYSSLLLLPQVEAIIETIPDGAAELRASLRRARTSDVDSALEKVQEAAAAIDSAAAEASKTQPATPGVQRVEVQQPFRMWDWLWYGSVNAFFMAGQGLTVVFLTLFLLIEGDSFKRKLVRRIDGLGNRRITVQVFNAIADQMHRFIWVQILTSGLVAVATGLALWWLGMEQPAVWGVFAGVMNIVPYFGPLVVTVVLTLVAFLQFSSLEMAVQVAGITLVITTIEGMALTPHLISRSASINHVALFLALAFWSWAWGGPGLLLAVPLLMMVKAVCDHVPGLDGLADFLGTTPDEPRPVETRQADGVGIGSSRA